MLVIIHRRTALKLAFTQRLLVRLCPMPSMLCRPGALHGTAALQAIRANRLDLVPLGCVATPRMRAHHPYSHRVTLLSVCWSGTPSAPAQGGRPCSTIIDPPPRCRRWRSPSCARRDTPAPLMSTAPNLLVMSSRTVGCRLRSSTSARHVMPVVTIRPSMRAVSPAIADAEISNRPNAGIHRSIPGLRAISLRLPSSPSAIETRHRRFVPACMRITCIIVSASPSSAPLLSCGQCDDRMLATSAVRDRVGRRICAACPVDVATASGGRREPLRPSSDNFIASLATSVNHLSATRPERHQGHRYGRPQ